MIVASIAQHPAFLQDWCSLVSHWSSVPTRCGMLLDREKFWQRDCNIGLSAHLPVSRGIEKTTFVSACSSRRVLITSICLYIYMYIVFREFNWCPRPQCSCSGSFSAHHVRGVWHPSGSDYLATYDVHPWSSSGFSFHVVSGGSADWISSISPLMFLQALTFIVWQQKHLRCLLSTLDRKEAHGKLVAEHWSFWRTTWLSCSRHIRVETPNPRASSYPQCGSLKCEGCSML